MARTPQLCGGGRHSTTNLIAFGLTVVLGMCWCLATAGTTAGSRRAARVKQGHVCVGGWTAFQPVPKVPTSPHQQASSHLTTVQPRLWRCVPVRLFRQHLMLRAGEGDARRGTLSREVLECMSRRQLQEVAKSMGVRANLRSTDIVDQLLVVQRGDASKCALNYKLLTTKLISINYSCVQ